MSHLKNILVTVALINCANAWSFCGEGEHVDIFPENVLDLTHASSSSNLLYFDTITYRNICYLHFNNSNSSVAIKNVFSEFTLVDSLCMTVPPPDLNNSDEHNYKIRVFPGHFYTEFRFATKTDESIEHVLNTIGSNLTVTTLPCE